MSSVGEIETKLEAESRSFQDLQKELTKLVELRQRLDAQQQENEQVEKEFQALDTDASIYKLIGPVLVKQEKGEATSNVKNRLELIKGEIKRVEGQLKEGSEKAEKKRAEIGQLQAQYQQLVSARQ